MMDVGRHPNIELLAYSEIEDVTGYVGNFKARIRKKARYVDENECTSCGDCAAVCPVVVPDEFQMGLGSRKAVYIPFPQAVPSSYVVAPHECLGHLEGKWGRPSDLQRPERIGFIQCVGSRTQDPERGNPYCSNVCCMNTVKEAQYLKDNYPDTDITVFYMDMRAFGKGFEELLMRSKMSGVRYIRGLPGEVRQKPDDGNLWVTVENTTANRLEVHEFEMLVLAVGATPATDTEAIRQLVSLSRSPSGFLKEAHAKLRPVDTPTKGVYIAGAAESPKDVRESVTQASAAASRASILLNKSQFAVEAITAVVDKDLCKLCGQCAAVCPFGTMWTATTSTPIAVPYGAWTVCGTAWRKRGCAPNACSSSGAQRRRAPAGRRPWSRWRRNAGR